MHANDLVADEGRHRETIENVAENLPELDAVATLALVIETVDSVDGGALVIASQKEEILGISKRRLTGLKLVRTHLILYASRRQIVSRDCFPRST